MNKQKIKEIVKFSIKQNIQNKWFVAFNILLLVLILLITNAGHIRNFLENNNIHLFDDEIAIEYVDPHNLSNHAFEKMFADNPKVTVKKVGENKYTTKNIEDNLLIVEIEKDEERLIKAKITSKQGFDSEIYDEIVTVLEEARAREFSNRLKVSEEQLAVLNKDIKIDRIMLAVNAENSEEKQMIQMVSTIIVYMISIFIFSKIANEIANEKVSKSIEYVLTSVTAKEYLLAKIISVTAIVLIQAVFVLVYYMTGNLINSGILMLLKEAVPTTAVNSISVLDRDIVLYICTLSVYSILTLILLAIIQAALSSKTTSMSEAGNSMTFLMVITVAVYFFTLSVINPYTNMSAFIYILSCIPLISNYFVPAIMIIGQANIWQIIISLALLVISIPVAFNKCSVIFKNGVLDYTNKKTRKRKEKVERSLKEEQALRIDKAKFRTLALILGMSVIILLVSQLASELVLNIILYPLLDGIMAKTEIEFLVMGLVSLISLGLAYLFLKLYVNKEDVLESKGLSGKDCIKLFFLGLFFTGILQWIIIYAQAQWGFRNTAVYEMLDKKGLDSFVMQVVYVGAIAIIPAIFEELFFRKGLIDVTRRYGDKFAILVSAFIFAVSHLNLAQSLFAFFMGIILGTMYVKSGQLRWGIFLHGFNNLYAALGWIFSYCDFDFGYYGIQYLGKALFIFSIAILIFEIIRRIRAKEKLVVLVEGKLIPSNVRYMLTDYTFVLGAIFVACTFTITEIMLNML